MEPVQVPLVPGEEVIIKKRRLEGNTEVIEQPVSMQFVKATFPFFEVIRKIYKHINKE